MVSLLRLEGTQFTYVSDGFRKLHVKDPTALDELQRKGVWPREIIDVSRKALEQLAGDF